MEFCAGGDLAAAITAQKRKGKPFEEFIVQSWFGQLASGLMYMQQVNLIHRDLKPANVFLTSLKILKIGDFGLSKSLESSNLATQTACGTPIYMAPEVLIAFMAGTKGRYDG